MDAELLGGLAVRGVVRRLALLDMTGRGGGPVVVHEAGVLAQLQQHLGAALAVAEQEDVRRGDDREALGHAVGRVQGDVTAAVRLGGSPLVGVSSVSSAVAAPVRAAGPGGLSGTRARVVIDRGVERVLRPRGSPCRRACRPLGVGLVDPVGDLVAVLVDGVAWPCP